MPGPLSSGEVEPPKRRAWHLSNDLVPSLDPRAGERASRLGPSPGFLSPSVSGPGGVLEFEPDIRASSQSLNTPAS